MMLFFNHIKTLQSDVDFISFYPFFIHLLCLPTVSQVSTSFEIEMKHLLSIRKSVSTDKKLQLNGS